MVRDSQQPEDLGLLLHELHDLLPEPLPLVLVDREKTLLHLGVEGAIRVAARL